MKLLIVSGLSGSGKSETLNTLEDLGYFCTDNLPVDLLPAFTEQFTDQQQTIRQVAVGIDIRSISKDLRYFSQLVDNLRNKGVDIQIVFLKASDEILLKRFSETRRKHPLSNNETHLKDAIKREKEILEPVSAKANLILDTSRTNIHQLRELIRTRIPSTEKGGVSILVHSFGFKNGAPTDADFIFDVRCLPNPYWEPRLRKLTGKDQDVIQFLDSQPEVRQMIDSLDEFLKKWIPEFKKENRNYLTIAIGCTGGQHRSVYIATKIAERLKTLHPNTVLQHRELP